MPFRDENGQFRPRGRANGGRTWTGRREVGRDGAGGALVGVPFGAAGRAKWMRNAICTRLAGAVCGRRAWPRRLPGGLQMDERRGRARPFFSACNPAFSSQRRGLGHRKSRRAGIGGATTHCARRNSPVGRVDSPALGSPLCLWRRRASCSPARWACSPAASLPGTALPNPSLPPILRAGVRGGVGHGAKGRKSARRQLTGGTRGRSKRHHSGRSSAPACRLGP